MFGLATAHDVRMLKAEVMALREELKASKDSNKDLSTKLYTVEVLQGGKPFRTYRDVVSIEDNSHRRDAIFFGCVSSLTLKTRNGDVILRGEGYTYISTEQKPEGGKKPQPTNEWVISADALKGKSFLEYMLDMQKAPCTLGDLARTRTHLESEMAKKIDALNHRIEVLELRLGNQSFGKQTDAEPKPMSAAYKRIVRNAKAKKAKPQPKGVKR